LTRPTERAAGGRVGSLNRVIALRDKPAAAPACRHGRAGRRLGNGCFVERLEAMVGRILRPQKRGPKPRPRANEFVCPGNFPRNFIQATEKRDPEMPPFQTNDSLCPTSQFTLNQHRIGLMVLWAVAMMVPSMAAAVSSDPGQPSTCRLLVDDVFIESMRSAKRIVHRLRLYEGNPIMVQDKPWECHKEFRYYPSVVMWANPVLRDSQTGKFRMWYTGFNDLDDQGRETGLLLYAESTDGIHWTKPDLGITEWKGSSKNNIVLLGPVDENGGKLRHFDTPNIIYCPDAPCPKDRYRLLAWVFSGVWDRNHHVGVWLYRSADGFHWELLKRDAIPNAQEFNSFFWDAQKGKFIGLVRVRGMWPRVVGYTESRDFLNWSKAEPIIEPKDLNTRFNLRGDDVYGLCGFPYESHYIGFLHTHHTDRRLEVQLMCSTNARDWSFVGEGEYVLPNDPRGGYGQGMMSTMSGSPIRVGDELWIYIGISPCAHSTNPDIQNAPGQQKRVIGLAKLRLDGFASIEAVDENARMITKPFTLPTGRKLYVNARIDQKGELRAALCDGSGNSLPGFSLSDFKPIRTGGIRLGLSWAGGEPPSGIPIKLQFQFRNTGIYSFGWN
jgi:hypothetical protein